MQDFVSWIIIIGSSALVIWGWRILIKRIDKKLCQFQARSPQQRAEVKKRIENSNKDTENSDAIEQAHLQKQPIWVTIGIVIAVYWIIFYGALYFFAEKSGGYSFLSPDEKNGMLLAPFLMPFFWIWGLIENEKFWYCVAIVVVLNSANYQIERLHGKLDRIIRLLEKSE